MNEREKNASIDYILARGLVKPQRARERIAEMARALGLRFIFWDTGYSLLFAAVTVAMVVAVFAFTPRDYRRSAAVGAAPLAFLIITLFAEVSERAGGLYELKQTCRYTVRQVAALRALCYSTVGVAFTAVVAAASASGAREFASLFPVCLSALFICAVLGLSVMRFIRAQWAYAAYSAVWVSFSLTFPLALGQSWENALRDAPVALSAALAAVGAGIFIHQISRMLSEVKVYAVAS